MKQHINRILSALLALVLCVGLLAAGIIPASAADGTCGDNLTWRLENGILTITGSGAMPDFQEGTSAPWLEYVDQIQCVKVGDGVTSIGDLAFYHCINLTAVSLPSSVKTLGELALAGCYNLMQISIPGVEEIGLACFYDCTALNSITLPDGLRVIEDKAFYHCSSLAGITIPASVETFGNSVFCYSENLVYVKFNCQISVLPYWTFYGCDRLNELYLPGSIETVENSALSECPNLNYVSYIGSEEVEQEIEKQLAEETQKRPIDISGTKVSYDQTEGATVTVKTENSAGTTVNATVTGPSGWEDVVDSVVSATKRDPSPTVEVQLQDNMTMSEGILSGLANKDVTINIETSDNVSWEVIMRDQTGSTLNTTQNFTVEISKNNTAVFKDFIGNAVSYTITLGQTGLNSTIKLPLGMEAARKVATLYAINGKKLEKLCSVIVDDKGRAAFCLAGTTAGDYILALDVQGIDPDSVTIPKSLAAEYGIDYNDGTLMDMYGNKYILTGVNSQLGFGIGTLTLIILGVLVGSAVVVGAIMITWNKQKKKQTLPVAAERKEYPPHRQKR